jgi:hypothetical protein
LNLLELYPSILLLVFWVFSFQIQSHAFALASLKSGSGIFGFTFSVTGVPGVHQHTLLIILT